MAGSLLADETLEVGTDFFLDDTPVHPLLGTAVLKRLHDDILGLSEHAVTPFGRDKSACDDLGLRLDLACVLIDGNDRHHYAVFGKQPAVSDDDVFDDLVHRPGVNTNPTYIYSACAARATAIKLQDIAAFQQESFFNL